MKIIVNGVERELDRGRKLTTYGEICSIAGIDRSLTPSMTFAKGTSDNPEGILSPGGTVPLKDGMVFSVCVTGAA